MNCRITHCKAKGCKISRKDLHSLIFAIACAEDTASFTSAQKRLKQASPVAFEYLSTIPVEKRTLLHSPFNRCVRPCPAIVIDLPLSYVLLSVFSFCFRSQLIVRTPRATHAQF